MMDASLPPLLHGIDIVEVPRVAKMIDEHGERVLSRCFTDAERAYCEEQSKRAAEHFAARFAAKEAVFKALGTGWRGQIAWTDAEVLREDSGCPRLKLHGECRRLAEKMQIASWVISLSHTEQYAMASVIGLVKK